MKQAPQQARRLTKTKLYGVLSTQSRSMPGYPFGSLVQYCLDNNGDLILYLSDIAQHTKNIREDERASITIIDENMDDLQNSARATILGNITACAENDPAIEIYNNFFPESADYSKVHDFAYYRMSIARVRYIGGFGDINWVSKENFNLSQIFNRETINSVISHMNQDHQAALNKYLNAAETSNAKLSHFDQEGMWLTQNQRIHYIPFIREANTSDELRQILIEMSK